jgi:hypothetical protein
LPWRTSRSLRCWTMMPKTVCAPLITALRDKASSTSALTTSTPSWARGWAEGAVGSRVTARSLYCLESSACSGLVVMTEPPYWPVAPKTTRSLLMFVWCGGLVAG